MVDYAKLRKEMVRRQIGARGVRDKKVLDAMQRTPRERFTPARLKKRAYEDTPLPIGAGQTISQPYMVAMMIEALRLEGGEKLLEIGAGSGYAAAVLAQIAGSVFALERIGSLARTAAAHLKETGHDNVFVRHDDGTLGWSEQAPFDAILVSAGAPDIPEALLRQLGVGGRMVIPVGASKQAQKLIRVTRTDERQYQREELGDVRFVPLIGAKGWCEEALEDPEDPQVPPGRPGA